jgi:Lipocalin-like domain
MRVIVLLLLLLTPALVHAGPPAFVGKWSLDAVRTKDGPVPKEKLAGGGMTWEFKADHTLVMTVWKGEQSVTANGTWQASGKKLTVDENGQKNTMTWKKVGAKLQLAGTGNSTVVMTFVKAKK